MEAATIQFFEDTPKCDLAVFLTDIDNEPKRRKKILDWTNEYSKENLGTNFVVGCPDPHLEQWFLNDPIALKLTFSLPNDSSLPHVSINYAKHRIKKIIKEHADLTKSFSESYAEIALNFNLQNNDRSFKLFYKMLRQALRTICAKHRH
jgi:hypothetical protein